VFLIHDILVRIRTPGSVDLLTNQDLASAPDPVLSFSYFQNATKKYFFFLILSVGTFTSVFKGKRSLKGLSPSEVVTKERCEKLASPRTAVGKWQVDNY
jgi:hypothetical protein